MSSESLLFESQNETNLKNSVPDSKSGVQGTRALSMSMAGHPERVFGIFPQIFDVRKLGLPLVVDTSALINGTI